MKKNILFGVSILLLVIVISSCGHRDCQGRKKTVRTEMGGWL